MKAQTIRQTKAMIAAFGISIFASACGEVAGVENGMGEVQVTLQEASAEALFQVMTTDFVGAPEATAGRVRRELVRSLDVTVTGIQILPYCEDAGEQTGDSRWM